MSDLRKEEWARQSVERIESAVRTLNGSRSESGAIRIVWGEDPRYQPPDDIDLKQQYGLMDYSKESVEIMVCERGDAYLPNLCHFRIFFSDDFLVPLESASRTYNLLKCLDDGVSLAVLPNHESRGIEVSGVETSIPVETLNARLLQDVLSRLVKSCRLARLRLSKDEGDDHWSIDDWSDDE